MNVFGLTDKEQQANYAIANILGLKPFGQIPCDRVFCTAKLCSTVHMEGDYNPGIPPNYFTAENMLFLIEYATQHEHQVQIESDDGLFNVGFVPPGTNVSWESSSHEKLTTAVVDAFILTFGELQKVEQ